jgi:hypothetical protein
MAQVSCASNTTFGSTDPSWCATQCHVHDVVPWEYTLHVCTAC